MVLITIVAGLINQLIIGGSHIVAVIMGSLDFNHGCAGMVSLATVGSGLSWNITMC